MNPSTTHKRGAKYQITIRIRCVENISVVPKTTSIRHFAMGRNNENIVKFRHSANIFLIYGKALRKSARYFLTCATPFQAPYGPVESFLRFQAVSCRWEKALVCPHVSGVGTETSGGPMKARALYITGKQLK